MALDGSSSSPTVDRAVRRERAEYTRDAQEDVPLGTYAGLTGVYLAAVGGFALAARAAGVGLPEQVPARDVALLGVATFKLTQLVSRDRVTAWLRAPFTRFQGASGGPSVEEEPRPQGFRKGVGDLLTCPWCTAQWVVTGLACAYLVAPRPVRYAATALTALTVSDGLTYASSALESRTA
ncbi:MAG TPA: DUF1360 domain-containing protein [Motilibacteraceae bacterium]|nr:DUF1360 domain-containing protein [Motilibacteraceae bacterium]